MNTADQIAELRQRIAQEQASRDFAMSMMAKISDPRWNTDLSNKIAKHDSVIARLNREIWNLEHPEPGGLWSRLTGRMGKK